jgi:crossover junction endodeoxyribonuclease RuvC
MNVAGLDLSLRAPGIALEHVAMVETRLANHRGPMRLASYRDYLQAAVAEWADVVVIEGYSMHSVSRAVTGLAELGGVIRLMLWEQKVPYVEVAPSRLKKFATGKGNANKDLMLASAIKRGADVDDNNAADAWWLRQMGVAHYDPDHALVLPAVQLLSVSLVAWPELDVAA